MAVLAASRQVTISLKSLREDNRYWSKFSSFARKIKSKDTERT